MSEFKKIKRSNTRRIQNVDNLANQLLRVIDEMYPVQRNKALKYKRSRREQPPIS